MISAALLAAAAASPDPSICTDRPAKANATCTVPAGRWQLEMSGIDWTRTKLDGSQTDATSFGASFLKLGLTDQSDLELGFAPHIRIETKDSATRDRVSGIGDIVVRYKRRLTDTEAPVQVALIPFVKLPTADHDIGNGRIEGGLAAPISLAAAPKVTLTFGPELDLLSDAHGRGHHLGVINLANLGVSPAPRLTLSAELWNSMNFDPAGTVRQWSADLAAAYSASNRVQLDAGANLGLSRATPDLELYAGVALLF